MSEQAPTAAAPLRLPRLRARWQALAHWVAGYMPKGLYARSLLIVILPMVILQSVIAYFFMERHWQTVTFRLSAGVVRDIGAVIDLYKLLPEEQARTDLRKIADHAGCEIAGAADPSGAIAAGLASARGDLLLVLSAGYAPQAGFIEEISDMFQRATRPDALRFRIVPTGFLTRLAPGFAPVRGLVAKRSVLDPKSPDFATLVSRAGAAPTARARLRRVD